MNNIAKGHSPAIGSLLLAVLCWGMAPVITRHLVSYLTPLHLVTLRFSLSALFMLPILLRLRQARWSLRDLAVIAGCGLATIMGYNVPVTFGSQWLPAGITSLIAATEPIWITLIARLVLKERLGPLTLVGFALAITGIVALVGGNAFGQTLDRNFVFGALLTLFGAFMWSVNVVAIRPLNRKYSAVMCTALAGIMGATPLLTVWNNQLVASASALPTEALIALLVLTLCSTVLGTLFWNYGLSRLPGAQASVFLYLVPLVAVTGGAVLLKESITPGMIIGGAMIVSGVALAQKRVIADIATQPTVEQVAVPGD